MPRTSPTCRHASPQARAGGHVVCGICEKAGESVGTKRANATCDWAIFTSRTRPHQVHAHLANVPAASLCSLKRKLMHKSGLHLSARKPSQRLLHVLPQVEVLLQALLTPSAIYRITTRPVQGIDLLCHVSNGLQRVCGLVVMAGYRIHCRSCQSKLAANSLPRMCGSSKPHAFPVLRRFHLPRDLIPRRTVPGCANDLEFPVARSEGGFRR